MNLLLIIPISLILAALGAFGLYAYVCKDVADGIEIGTPEWEKRQNKMFNNLLNKN